MSTSNIIIKEISLYDLDIKTEPTSDDDDHSNHAKKFQVIKESFSFQNDAILKTIKDEVIDDESPVLNVDCGVLNADIGTSLADFKAEMDDSDTIINQTWQSNENDSEKISSSLTEKFKILQSPSTFKVKEESTDEDTASENESHDEPPPKLIKLNNHQILPMRILKLNDFKKFKIVKSSDIASKITDKVPNLNLLKGITIKKIIQTNIENVDTKKEQELDLPAENESDSDNFSEFDTDREDESSKNDESLRKLDEKLRKFDEHLRKFDEHLRKLVKKETKPAEQPRLLPTVDKNAPKPVKILKTLKKNPPKILNKVFEKLPTVDQAVKKLPQAITVVRKRVPVKYKQLPIIDPLQLSRSEKLLPSMQPDSVTKLFKCPTCKMSFTTSQRYISHVHQNGNENCRLNFNNDDDGTGRLPVVKKGISCTDCSATFSTRAQLYSHTYENHNKHYFECQKCKRKFNRPSRLTEHLMLHENSDAFACKLCSKRFTRSDLLNSHMRTRHAVMNKFMCGICDYRTMVKQNFDKHESMHVNHMQKLKTNQYFRCVDCPQSFRVEEMLKTHRERVHEI